MSDTFASQLTTCQCWFIFSIRIELEQNVYRMFECLLVLIGCIQFSLQQLIQI